MYERRWGLIAGVVVAVVLAGVIGWFAGRSSAPDSANAESGGSASGAIRVVDGVPIGVQHTRAGALAAADNYVTVATETAIQDPERYEALVRRAYASEYQATALREGRDARRRSPRLVDEYRNGRKGLAIVGARRLDSYSAGRADVTTWRAGVVWSPTSEPFTQWFLTETQLQWDGERWRVLKTDDARRAAPAPPIRYEDREGLRSETFDRELRGMRAPFYGAAE